MPLKANTTEVITSISLLTFSLGVDNTYKIAANPHQANVVKCQANLKHTTQKVCTHVPNKT